jgi:hypothetical protein
VAHSEAYGNWERRRERIFGDFHKVRRDGAQAGKRTFNRDTVQLKAGDRRDKEGEKKD